jgi:hypothetical protein
VGIQNAADSTLGLNPIRLKRTNTEETTAMSKQYFRYFSDSSTITMKLAYFVPTAIEWVEPNIPIQEPLLTIVYIVGNY